MLISNEILTFNGHQVNKHLNYLQQKFNANGIFVFITIIIIIIIAFIQICLILFNKYFM